MLLSIGMVSAAPLRAQTQGDWRAEWDKALAAAKKEGTVVVFGPPGDVVRQALTGGFKKAYPDIGIEFVGGTGNDLATKIRAERDGGVYSVDVVLSGTTTSNLYLKPVGVLDPIAPALILPEVTAPKYWRDGLIEYSDTEGKYNLVFVNALRGLVMYNLDSVKPQEADDLDKLLDPKWKGKLVINDPLPSGPGYQTFRWIWTVLGPKEATDYYRRIRSHAGTVDQDQRRQIEWVANGKYPILFGGNTPVAQQLVQRGLKIGMITEFAKHGTAVSANFGSLMLINKAPHPNATKIFANWILTKEGQTAWSKATNDLSRRIDVPTDHVPSYLFPKPGGKFFVKNYKPGDRYWLSHSEENIGRSPEEEKLLKELFGR